MHYESMCLYTYRLYKSAKFYYKTLCLKNDTQPLVNVGNQEKKKKNVFLVCIRLEQILFRWPKAISGVCFICCAGELCLVGHLSNILFTHVVRAWLIANNSNSHWS